LGIEPEPDVNISVGFSLQAVNSPGHCHTAIDELEPRREIYTSKRRSPFAFSGMETEFDERDLDPKVAG
jgi:hypothetical protein